MKNVKLIMLDMDGTLFTNDKRITEKTRNCLIAMKEKGIAIAIATGRAIFNIERILREYQLEDIVEYVVGLNGVEITNRRNNTVVYHDQMSCEMTKDVYAKIQHTDMNVITYTSESVYARYDEPRVHKLCKNLQLSLQVYDYSKDKNTWNKVLIMRNYPFTQEECKYLLSMKNDFYHGFLTDVDCYEIVNSNVSKASGIRVLCDQLGITMNEVMAFGDSGNDVDMLKAVGYGVVMANGSLEAKNAAKYETLSNEEDGVAYFLEKYVGGCV